MPDVGKLDSSLLPKRCIQTLRRRVAYGPSFGLQAPVAYIRLNRHPRHRLAIVLGAQHSRCNSISIGVIACGRSKKQLLWKTTITLVVVIGGGVYVSLWASYMAEVTHLEVLKELFG